MSQGRICHFCAYSRSMCYKLAKCATFSEDAFLIIKNKKKEIRYMLNLTPDLFVLSLTLMA